MAGGQPSRFRANTFHGWSSSHLARLILGKWWKSGGISVGLWQFILWVYGNLLGSLMNSWIVGLLDGIWGICQFWIKWGMSGYHDHVALKWHSFLRVCTLDLISCETWDTFFLLKLKAWRAESCHPVLSWVLRSGGLELHDLPNMFGCLDISFIIPLTYIYMYMYMYILCMCRMIYSQKIIVFRCVQHGCDFVYGPNMDPHVFLSALPQAPSLRQSNWSQPGMVKLQFTNPTDYDVRVEAGGMVRYLSPKNEKSVDRCEFPEGNYQQFRVWYVDSTGHNQLAGPKPYTVKNDPGVDLYGYGSKLGTSIIGWLILN